MIKIINEKIRKALEIEEEIYNKEVKNFFKGKSKDEINEIIKFIKFNIYHMAPILLYVKDKTFSTFYNYNNLIKRIRWRYRGLLLNDLPYKSAENG